MTDPQAAGQPEVGGPRRASIWHSILHTYATSLGSVAIGLLTTVVLARVLGPTGKGAYDLLLATAMLLMMFLGGSLASGITYVVARGRANLGRLVLQLGPIAGVQSIVGAGALLLVTQTRWSEALLPPDAESWAILPVALFTGLYAFSGHLRAILMGRQEVVFVNNVDLVGRAMTLGLVLLGAGALILSEQRPAIAYFIWANVVVVLITVAVQISALRPRLTRTRAPELSGLGEAASFAVPAYLGNVTQFLNYRLDIFIVGFVVGVKGVGLYALAVGQAQLIWILSSAIAAVMLPDVAATRDGGTGHVLRIARAVRLSFWASSGLALGMGVLAAPLIPLVFGEPFRGSILPLLLLLPGIGIFSITNVLAAYFAGIGKPRWNLAVALVGLSATIMLDLLLIPRFGISGAAIASSASYAVSTVLTLWIFVRSTRVSLRTLLLPTRTDVMQIWGVVRTVFGRAVHAEVL